MESIDELLAQIEVEYKGQEQSKLLKGKPVYEEEKLPSKLLKTQASQTQYRDKGFGSNAEDKLLLEVKTEFEKLDQVEQLKREQYQREKKRTEEQRLVKRRQELTQQANEWLKSLDINSQEGLWFEEFAYNYSSKLEAAIDYLQALDKTSS